MHSFDYSKEEALELGKIEGQKHILKELLDLKSDDIIYMNAYIKTRLTSIDDGVKLFLKLKGVKVEQVK